MGKCACVRYDYACAHIQQAASLPLTLILLTKWLNFFNANNHKFPQNEWQFPGLSLYHLTLQLCAIHWAALALKRSIEMEVVFSSCKRKTFAYIYLFFALSLSHSALSSLWPLCSLSRFVFRFGVNANWKIEVTLPLLNHHHHRSASFRLEWGKDESNSSNQALYLNISSSLPSI